MTTLNLHRVASFECSSCGSVHNSQGGLPVGWSAHAGSAWCASCTALEIPRRELRGQRRARA